MQRVMVQIRLMSLSAFGVYIIYPKFLDMVTPKRTALMARSYVRLTGNQEVGVRSLLDLATFFCGDWS